MKLIVGLGNPGSQYESTRHNIGFILLDLFAGNFQGKFKAGKGDWLECQIRIGDKDVYLMKPLTFMNNSGVAVKEFIEKHGIDNKDVLVVVDDFQLPLGTIRIRRSGSDGGHNGLASIIYHLNSDEFARMRVGIGKNDVIRKDEYVDYVLSNFEKDETTVIKELIPHYNECLKSFVADGISKTMNRYNKSFLNKDNNTNKKSEEDKKD